MRLTLIKCDLCDKVLANAIPGKTVPESAVAWGWELATQYRKAERDLCPDCAHRVAEGRKRAPAKEGTANG